MKHVARKRFGQHFLADVSIIDAIVAAVRPERGDTVVEIGPGLSALTEPLLARLDHLHVVEIDRDLAARLRKRHPAERLSVHEADALAFDFGTVAPPERPLRVVGNLPYNISSPLLFHLAQYAERVADQHFMLQKEVVERMVAEPGSGDYSRLSVMLQVRYDMESLFDVPPEAFDPPPRVDSAVVRMIPKPVAAVGVKDPALFARVVAQAFSQRRKMLRNTLAEFDARVPLAEHGLMPTARAEEIPVAAFVAYANALGRPAP
jgi:16S rRNA (adenine1518-N6/adenine1519-N6)-dimethyltransferase